MEEKYQPWWFDRLMVWSFGALCLFMFLWATSRGEISPVWLVLVSLGGLMFALGTLFQRPSSPSQRGLRFLSKNLRRGGGRPEAQA
jgi:peptidoglycan/LPS O-acetylase OafA/YrhL